MDAISLLNTHIDVEKLLNHYNFDNIMLDGKYIRSSCKIHNGDNPSSFVINTETGLWFCHTNCGGGDVYTLVQKMENINFTSSVNWLANFYEIDITNLKIIERKAKYLSDLKKFINVIKGNKIKTFEEFFINEEIKEISKFRDFKPDTIEHFKLGYVEEATLTNRAGKVYTLHNRLVFPIYFNNKQVSISFRRIKSKDNPKWLHQPTSFETGNILYNYDAVKSAKEIVVCEGITDVWAFHELGLSAVATFGAHITYEQYKLLLKTGADLIICFDGDDAGQNALIKAIKMFKNKANLSIIRLNNGEDPENIGREELLKRYELLRKS